MTKDNEKYSEDVDELADETAWKICAVSTSPISQVAVKIEILSAFSKLLGITNESLYGKKH